MGSLTDDYPGLNPITVETIQIKEEYSYPLTQSASAPVPSNSVIAPVVKPGMPMARFNSLGWPPTSHMNSKVKKKTSRKYRIELCVCVCVCRSGHALIKKHVSLVRCPHPKLVSPDYIPILPKPSIPNSQIHVYRISFWGWVFNKKITHIDYRLIAEVCLACTPCTSLHRILCLLRCRRCR